MSLIIFLLLAFFCAVAFMQHMKKESVNAGSLDKPIEQLISRYRLLREHMEEVDCNAFEIGFAREKDKRGVQDQKKALAVRILDEKGRKRDGAAGLGMEVIENKGRYYYQFPVELETRLSGAEMTAVLVRIKEKLERRYPYDLVSMADAYLTVVIDGKNLLNLLGGHTGAKHKQSKEGYSEKNEDGEQDDSSHRANFGAKQFLLPKPVLIIGTYDENGMPNSACAAWEAAISCDEITINLSEHNTSDNPAVRGAFTVSMATEKYIHACEFVGEVSACEDSDKFEKAGFHAVKSSFVDAPLIKELPLAMECKVKSFSDGILVGKIVNVCADKRILTDGKVDFSKLDPVAFDPMNSTYYRLGEKIGDAAFRQAKKVK